MKTIKLIPAVSIWLGAFFALATVFSVNGFAGEALAPPQQVIESTSNQLQSTLQKPEFKSDFKKATQFVDRVISSHVDFDRVSALVLGKNWKGATQAQKEQFKKEFRMLLVRTYTTAFTEYSDWKIEYLPLEPGDDDKKIVVKTLILQSGGHPVAVNYRMVKDGDDWRVYDILIEGVSLLQNYRSSFNDDIEQGSLDALIKKLADRNVTALNPPPAEGQ
jgi:phospholipid transport system substrate-binding protein